jgi:hypothetical protein
MPRYGGFSPYPLRYGGGEGNSSAPLLQRVFESIAAQRGSAYDQTTQSAVGVENMANARAITFDLYGANARLANQFRPATMTADGLLPRWERIFNTPTLPGDTEATRRARVGAAWASIGLVNTHQAVVDALTATLGPLFSGIIAYQSPATATAFWPGAGNNTARLPFVSTILHIDVQVNLVPPYVVPNTSPPAPNALFWAAVAVMVPVLDAMLPSWVTFDFYTLNSHGTTGFYLDEPDLDLQILDV